MSFEINKPQIEENIKHLKSKLASLEQTALDTELRMQSEQNQDEKNRLATLLRTVSAAINQTNKQLEKDLRIVGK